MSAESKDITGFSMGKFGRIIPIRFLRDESYNRGDGRIGKFQIWECQCECGNIFEKRKD